MMADKPKRRFGYLCVLAVSFGLLVSSAFVLYHFPLYVRAPREVHPQVTGNIADVLITRDSETDDLSWLHGKSTTEENPDDHNVEVKPNKTTLSMIPHSWPVNHRVRRDVKVNKATLPHYWPMNVRDRRASKQGKSSFDDSYFSGPGTSCLFPEGLQTVDLRCKIWPTYTRCISYCVYGSTFDEGIQREHSCKFKENKWSRDFDECKPFVNCKVQLKSPGKVKCFDNELINKPYCEIYCEIHEDKDEVETQSYHCNANATWTPPLPFCAEPREHVTLAKAPKVIEHTSFSYPQAIKP